MHNLVHANKIGFGGGFALPTEADIVVFERGRQEWLPSIAIEEVRRLLASGRRVLAVGHESGVMTVHIEPTHRRG